jgi:hypothetical protein
MGPRAKKTDDEKQAEYEAWCITEECAAIDTFRLECLKMKVDNAWTDITQDFQPYLNKKHHMCQTIKPKVGKAKSYEQMYMRTMFFDKCEKKTIDGHTYEISNGSNVDMSNCKECLY